jgi:excisionase family DNA binding protein
MRRCTSRVKQVNTYGSGKAGDAMTEVHNRLLRPREVQEVVGLSRSAVYAYIASGVLPSVKVGKSVRVPSAALDEWIGRNTRGGTSGEAA